jgi:predicted alpha/beta superfamily hydrolase
MKNILLVLGLFALSFYSNAQSNKIVIGTIDTVNSKILGEKRVVWIYNPNKDTGIEAAKKRYPVIYLLDGDWHFSSVVGILEQMSFVNGNSICPEMIIVGITIPDRYRDLTPSYDSIFSKNSGGNKKFISFIKNELIPYIDSTYPVSSYKMLIGHSLGGLTAINTLVTYPELFNAYVAIDPSMWWDNQASLKETEKALSNNKFDNISLFLAIANSMDKGMDTVIARKDNTRNTLPIRSNLELSDLLNSSTVHKLNYQVKYYNNENHGSIPLIATYDGLHYIFNFYNLPLTKKDYADTTMSLGYRIENHYKIISEKMGYRINPSESTINTLGYNALFLKNLALAEYFFKLNVNNYPDSYNAYDSFGDYYIAVGNYEQATVIYKKALSIYDNMETRKKLESIQKK